MNAAATASAASTAGAGIAGAAVAARLDGAARAAESTAEPAAALAGHYGVALLIPAWVLVAQVLALLTRFACNTGWSNGALFAVPPMLLYAFACSFSTYYMCRAWPLAQRRALAVVAVFGTSALLAGAGWTALAALWNDALLSFGVAWAGVPAVRPALALMFVSQVILFGLAALGHYLLIELARVRASERQVLEARLMAQDAQLRMLRAQIDPHFLFNSLNSISALTGSAPAAARAMTIKLADFFRQTLCSDAERKVGLADELALTLDFLAIEQVRFGARLGVEHAVEPAAAECLLLPMILQPLAENAVKHGIATLADGGAVRIAATRLGSRLLLVVENDVDDAVAVRSDGEGEGEGEGEAEGAPSAVGAGNRAAIAAADRSRRAGRGMGLQNVRQRLAAAYGEQAALHWHCRDGRFRVELTVPAEAKALPCA